jgi:hypothetical protein
VEKLSKTSDFRVGRWRWRCVLLWRPSGPIRKKADIAALSGDDNDMPSTSCPFKEIISVDRTAADRRPPADAFSRRKKRPAHLTASLCVHACIMQIAAAAMHARLASPLPARQNMALPLSPSARPAVKGASEGETETKRDTKITPNRRTTARESTAQRRNTADLRRRPGVSLPADC